MTDGFAYYRVSTRAQADQGASLDTQQAAVRRYAESHDIVLRGELTDVLSGTRDDRPAYQELLSRLTPGSVVLVWRLDRIGRRKSELFRFFEECKQRHIGIVSVTQPEMSSELARDLLSVIAAYESQQLAERIKPNMAARAEMGRWMGRAPIGYRLPDAHAPDYADGHLVPSDDAETVREMFRAYLSGSTFRGIMWRTGYHGERVRHILHNRAYIGEVQFNDIVIPDAHPAIIDRALWDAVQQRMAARTHNGTRYRDGGALLTGLLYAEDTDVRMYRNAHRNRGAGYYVTDGNAQHINCSVEARLAERLTLDGLRQFTLSPAARRAFERDLTMIARSDPHKRAREALRRDRARLRDAVNRAALAYSRRLIDDDALAYAAKEHERERARLDAEERALPPVPDLARAMPVLAGRVGLDKRIDEMERRGDVAGLREALESHVKRIEAYDCRRTGSQGWTRRKEMLATEPRIVLVSILPE